MTTATPEKATPQIQATPAPPAPAPAQPPARLPGNTIARLLTRISRWPAQYADYQMEAGVWRKLSI